MKNAKRRRRLPEIKSLDEIQMTTTPQVEETPAAEEPKAPTPTVKQVQDQAKSAKEQADVELDEEKTYIAVIDQVNDKKNVTIFHGHALVNGKKGPKVQFYSNAMAKPTANQIAENPIGAKISFSPIKNETGDGFFYTGVNVVFKEAGTVDITAALQESIAETHFEMKMAGMSEIKAAIGKSPELFETADDVPRAINYLEGYFGGELIGSAQAPTFLDRTGFVLFAVTKKD